MMDWIRSKVKQASLLALFALALQLVFSFGHFHVDGSARAATFTVNAGAADQGIIPLDSPFDRQHPDELVPDSCAICAAVALANMLVIAAAPTLPAMNTFALAIGAPVSDFTLSSLTRPAFRSRAPPRP